MRIRHGMARRRPQSYLIACSLKCVNGPIGEGRILTVVFANRREPARFKEDRNERGDRNKDCLFEAGLECEVVNGELAEYPRVDPSLLTDEERELELQIPAQAYLRRGPRGSGGLVR